ASRGWRKLRGHHHLPDLVQGVKFIDGVNEHHLREEDLKSSQIFTNQHNSNRNRRLKQLL
ncbi:MAG: hypothetical protein WAO83_09425, partial [Fuerstiella sp.]